MISGEPMRKNKRIDLNPAHALHHWYVKGKVDYEKYRQLWALLFNGTSYKVVNDTIKEMNAYAENQQ